MGPRAKQPRGRKRLWQRKGERVRSDAPGMGDSARTRIARGRNEWRLRDPRLTEGAWPPPRETGLHIGARRFAPVEAQQFVTQAPTAFEPHPGSGVPRVSLPGPGDTGSAARFYSAGRRATRSPFRNRPEVLRFRCVPERLACPKARQDVPSASPSAEQGGGAARFFGLDFLIRLFSWVTNHPLRYVGASVSPVDWRIFKPGASMRRSISFLSWMPRAHVCWANFALGTTFLVFFAMDSLAEKKMITEVRQPPPYEWTQFVKVAGQPEPVPVEWVSTPEGKFAHSIVIPNPVPADSGYKWWWSAKRYHEHLCATEAGEFVFKKVENVEGLLFMRPPKRATDYDLKDARKLEAPAFENGFGRPHIGDRGGIFVDNDRYQFVEEPAEATEPGRNGYFRASGPLVKPNFWLRDIVHESEVISRYGVTWRGIVRENDRNNAISGYEILVLDLRTKEVLGVTRDYGRTGTTRNTRGGIWWLNARRCPQYAEKYASAGTRHLADFLRQVLLPSTKVNAEGK